MVHQLALGDLSSSLLNSLTDLGVYDIHEHFLYQMSFTEEKKAYQDHSAC
jgi:hypothetical protein